jgi:O-acetyl-ADP-ribose deacetylase (regulator of RNase III)
MGSGVAGAIKRRGGASIEREAVSKGPINVGEAIATSAGALSARWVIHAAAMGSDLRTDGEKIDSATKCALRIAKDLNAESVALPSLGTGVGGFPVDMAAEIMVQRALDHTSESAFPRRIIFVLFTEDAKRAFDAAFEKVAR